jgi:hypothetical protein
MSTRCFICLAFAVALVFLAATPDARATIVTFDWPAAPGWTAGTPTAGQTKTQSFTSVNPNDITVAINNSGAGPQGMNWNAGYPQISANPDTGGLAVNALELLMASSSAAGTYTQVTVSFATPVTNLSLQLWDVDKVGGQFVDKISNIQALTDLGATIGADSVSSAVAGYNTITGTGLTTVIQGTANADNLTNQGTINIVFNGPITQFSFQWSNADPALGAQGISIGQLIYTPVPEIDPQWSVATAALVILAFEFLVRRKRKSSAAAALPKQDRRAQTKPGH